MAKDVIKNCLVTKTDVEVIKPYIDKVNSYLYRRYRGYHMGIDLKADVVYPLCSCVCTYVGYTDEDRWNIVLQYDRYKSFRYTQLENIYIEAGDVLDYWAGDPIAKTYQGQVHVEYLDALSKNDWPVRVMLRTYYKNDPIDYISGKFEFLNTAQLTEVKLSDMMQTDTDTLIASGYASMWDGK